MEVYIILYSILFLAAFFDNNWTPLSLKKSIVIFWVIVFTLFRGLRWECGTDWDQYLFVFENAKWNNIFTFNRYGDEYMEPMYMFFNVLIKALGGNYTIFLLITNYFILYTYAKFVLNETSTPILGFIILIVFFGFFPVRQHLAIAFLIISYKHLLKKKFLPFIFYTSIGIFTHASSILLLVLYFIAHVRFHLLFLIIAYVGSYFISKYIDTILLFVFVKMGIIGPMFANRVEVYLRISQSEATRGIASFILGLFFICLYSYIRFKNKLNAKEYIRLNVSLNLYVVSLCIMNLFSAQFQDLGRAASNLTPSLAILLPGAVYYFGKKNVVFFFIACFIFVLYVIYRFSSFFDFYPEAHFPYRSIFN